MQINNSITGKFNRISNIKIQSNSVEYSEFEASILNADHTAIVKEFKDEAQIHVFDKANLDLEQHLNENTNYEALCLNQLKDDLFENDSVSLDIQNWIYPERILRISIKNDFVLKNLMPINSTGDLSEIGQIIQDLLIEQFGFYIFNENSEISIIYLNTIKEGDLPVIAPYLGVEMWQETKI